MSAQDRYTKIIESLVNGEEAKASDLLHEAFVEKAREIWTDLVEQDELAEEEIEELDEAFGEDEDEDFLNDIESDEDEIEAEEAFGEAEEDDLEMGDDEAELELADDEEGEEYDFNADGEMDSHEEEHSEIEDKMVSVEDALADLKAEFAKLMGEEEAEEEGEGDEMEVEFGGEEEAEDEVEEEFTFEEADEELEEEVEELDESAELKKIGKDGKIHPVEMPNGEDGKASPTGPGADMGGDLLTIGKGGKEAGGKVKAPAQMTGFKHPGEGAELSKQGKGHGAEKKGAKPEAPKTDSMINKAPGPKK